ncbi:MAG TPA: sugar ABC transporter permease [Methylomirabilota bacterium]|jgi:multiple sugar transport system permease protein|nr:sugar ABC transporter permease [Methylomirabilota bacterium]
MSALPSIRRLRQPSLARREALWGYVFLSPWIVGFLALTLIPMAATLVFTFTNIDLAQNEPVRFVGLDNYARLLADGDAWRSLLVTFKYAALSLPVGLIIPFGIALLINSRYIRGRAAFRVLFFLPYVVPFVAGVLIWEGMLNAESGWVNGFLHFIGIAHPPNWLNEPGVVYPALVTIGIWGIGAGIIINLAGLQGIPTELYDAANIDGAGWWKTLRHITLPLMSPVIFYTLILGMVEVLQYFLVPLVINNGTGDPGGSTLFFNLYLYKVFFTYQDMSYGATLAWLLFAITLAISLLLFWSARRWVYYAGER